LQLRPGIRFDIPLHLPSSHKSISLARWRGAAAVFPWGQDRGERGGSGYWSLAVHPSTGRTWAGRATGDQADPGGGRASRAWRIRARGIWRACRGESGEPGERRGL